MTETVTLALQGKFVQLGADPEAPVLFVLSPDKQSIAITKAERHQSCSVALDASEAADLRDILNALAERESDPATRQQRDLKEAQSMCPLLCCHLDGTSCSYRKDDCGHAVCTWATNIWRPLADVPNRPSWCLLPKEPTP